MWVENIDRTTFLKKLYPQIPSVDLLRILSVTLSPIERKFCVSIAILQLPDKIPEKWKTKNGNAIKVDISFWVIQKAEVTSSVDTTCSEFSISKDSDNNLCIKICGGCYINAIAEAGAISNIDVIEV